MLVTVAFVLTLVTFVFQKSSTSYSGVVNIQADNQGAIYAATAVNAIKMLMEYDDANFDGMNDTWRAIPSIPVEGGFVSIEIRPADDRLPINSLTNADNNTKERVREAFDDLFSELEYDKEMWHSLHDWVNSDNNSEFLSLNIVGQVFNREGNSYKPRHAPLTSLPELRQLPEYSQVYNNIVQYLSVGEKDPKININFAPPEVIRALMPELDSYIDRIIEQREEQPFEKKDEIYALLGSSNRDTYTNILPFFDVKSTLFYVKIELNLLNSERYYHVLMRRNGKTMTVIRYIEGRSINYF